MIGGVAAAAAVSSFPFRVFSFPSEIVTLPLYGPDGGLAYGSIAVQLEKVRAQIPVIYQNDQVLHDFLVGWNSAKVSTGEWRSPITAPRRQDLFG